MMMIDCEMLIKSNVRLNCFGKNINDENETKKSKIKK